MHPEITKLDNGLRIASCKLPVETISIIVNINIGSRDECENTSGIAHFLEHMAFKGTSDRSAKQIAEEFDSIGGYFNAYTTRESTCYSVKILKDDFQKAINILADILQNSLFLPEEIEKEKNVIIQEIAESVDSPDDIIFDNWQSSTYKNQLFGRSILGTEDTISKFKSDDFKKYICRNYLYENIVISIVGNIEHNNILDIISDKFNSFNSKEPLKRTQASFESNFSYQYKDLEQSHLVMGFEACSVTHEDIYLLHLYAIIIGGGISSRLFQEIREKRGLCYSIEGFFTSYSDTGSFMIYTSAAPDKIPDIIEIMNQEIYNMTLNITQKELDRTLSSIKSNIIMSAENNLYKAEEIARSVINYNRYISSNEIIEKIQSKTIDNIQNYARKMLEKKPSIALIGKKDKL